MDYKSIIASLVKPDNVDSWITIEPDVFYKDGKPYGLIGTMNNPHSNILYIAATVKDVDDPFTVGMLKSIISMYKRRRICLVTEVESKQRLIRRALDRYDFDYEYKDGMMYSYGGYNV